MRTMSLGAWVTIIISLVFAIFLTILPLPDWIEWLRPLWVLMVVGYWAIALENRVGVGIAWTMGIVLDVLGGTLLGEHALALCIVVYIIAQLRRQLQNFSVWQQAFGFGILSFIYQLTLFITQALLQHRPTTFLFWMPVITTMVFWPWVFIILRDCRRRFNIA